MATAKILLDRAQTHLADHEAIWSRAELLLWLQDGYRVLVAQSHAAQRFTILPVPPRHTMSYTYPWERQHVQRGTARQWTYSSFDTRRQTTTLWELESREGLAAQAHHDTVTYLWELAFVSQDVDHHYRFALPKAHHGIRAVWHDHEKLKPLTVRELDRLDTAWYRESGEPQWWTPGLGDMRSFEVYEGETEYTDDYVQTALSGMARYSAGVRTYQRHKGSSAVASWDFAYTSPARIGHSGRGLRLTQDVIDGYHTTQVWERERHAGIAATSQTAGQIIGMFAWEAAHGATNVAPWPVGIIRRLTSPDRQYMPANPWRVPLGTARAWRSSVNNMLVWETVTPEVPLLEDTERSVPDMLPAPLGKYLIYYVLAHAFNRQGEGYNPNLALHWEGRFARSIAVMTRLANVAWRDVQFQRESQRRLGRTVLPQPQLPPEFPAVPWLR